MLPHTLSRSDASALLRLPLKALLEHVTSDQSCTDGRSCLLNHIQQMCFENIVRMVVMVFRGINSVAIAVVQRNIILVRHHVLSKTLARNRVTMLHYGLYCFSI